MAWSKKTFIDPPTVNICLAWVWFFVNIFFPGVGTMVVGFLTCSFENFLVGLFQLLLAPIVVGWVWSIWWGFDLVQVSRSYKHHVGDMASDVTDGVA